jgi:hypothetical protein
VRDNLSAAGSFFGGFRTPAAGASCTLSMAGIRNPTQNRSFDDFIFATVWSKATVVNVAEKSEQDSERYD